MNNETKQKKAFDVCRAYIGPFEQSVSSSKIADTVKMFSPTFPSVDIDNLTLMLEEHYNVRIDDFVILEGRDARKPWLNYFKSNRTEADWAFWNRYKTYLLNKYAPSTVSQTDKLTDTILDKLFDPTLTNIQIAKKGLVVGQVQAGKTSNYIGLVCKAADAGFNFIIILAGILNNLRSQTQTRIDEGFLGFDTQFERAYSKNQTNRIGVGLLKEFLNAKVVANSYTTSRDKGDFTKSAANSVGFNFNTKEPVVLVIKKNGSVLKNLISWLVANSENGKIDSKSLLLIDDEADHASVNTHKDGDDPAAINGYIRSLIGLFSRSAYVGYTATPFANIFIPQNQGNDLFPKDFIINIPAPSNYIGADKVFGITNNQNDKNDVLPIVNTITDYNDFVPNRHKKDDPLPDYNYIPESLKVAVKSFILTCAIRIARGQKYVHNSMLIHVSRYQAWQNHIKNLVAQLFDYYKDEIIAGDNQIYEELRKIFKEDSGSFKSYCTVTKQIMESDLKDVDKTIKVHSWEEIRAHIYEAVQKIEVMAINGSSSDALTYYDHKDTGISIIAIGGDKLSRGLTLEGLSVSYFLRSSKMYDTLLQMGRWFGYRPGYVDLCRLYLSPELNEWYRHITTANAELLDEFNYMAEIRETPDNYALKIQKDPGELMITAAGKMRSAETIEVSWAGRLVETYQLQLDKATIDKNYMLTDTFVSFLGNNKLEDNKYLWRGISANKVCQYLRDFILPKTMVKVNFDLISEYIEELNKFGELTHWNVAVCGTNKKNIREIFSSKLQLSLALRNRSTEIEGKSDTYYIRKNHILSQGMDEFIDLSDSLLLDAARYTKEVLADMGKQCDKYKPYPKIIREKFRPVDQPLLMIYPLDPQGANSSYDKKFTASDTPIIGLAISFPHSETNVAVSYAVNKILTDYREAELEFDELNDNTYDND